MKITVFVHSQTTTKLVNEAANDSARFSGRDRKIRPALGTNQIAGFGGFRPLASLEKNKMTYVYIVVQFYPRVTNYLFTNNREIIEQLTSCEKRA